MTEITLENEKDQKNITVTRASLIKYLAIFSIVTILISVVLGILFGAISGVIVNRYFAGSQVIQNQPLKVVNEQSAVISAVQKANPAVVSIIISKAVPNIPTFNPLDPFGFLNNGNNGNSNGGSSQQEVGGGSGFIITSDGLIVTNKHVAPDSSSKYTVILTNGKRYDGTIVAVDPTNDISIIKINASGLPTLSLGQSSNIQLGQQVIAIGNALGQYENTVNVGVISGINRVVTASDPSGSGSETLNGVLQTDAQINPGNSGGPLLDLNGNVIGINTAVAQNAQGIGFAIPIDQARTDIASVESTGTIKKPELGVRYQTIDANYLAQNPNTPVNYGALVTAGDSGQPAVVSGSPADKAGIQSGDIILSVNGTKLDSNNNTLTNLIQQHKVGDTVSVVIYRNGNQKTLSVRLSQSF